MSKYDRDFNTAARDANSGLARLVEGRTSFNELNTVEFTPVFELDPANGLTELRDRQIPTDGGSISDSNAGEITLSSGTTAGGKAILDTAEKGRYQPGIEALAGVALREDSAPTGNQYWRMGYFDDEDGYWLEKDSTGLYIGHRVNGVDKPLVPEAEWNSRIKGIELDFSRMTVIRFPFQCYYGGPLTVEGVAVDSAGNRETRTMHTIGPTDGEPILGESKLPVRVEVSNGGDTEDLTVHVGGRHFGVRGRYNPNRRETAETREEAATSTSLVPLVSFRKKADRVSKAKSIKVSGLGVLSDVDAVMEIHLNPTGLTDADFGSITNIPDSETAVEVNNTDTTMTAGQVLDRALVAGGQANRSNLSGIRRLGLDIPDDATITLAVRTVSGTGTATAAFTMEEEW